MEPIVKSLDAPDELRQFSKGIDAVVRVGSSEIARGCIQPGWRWSNDIRPLVGTTSCEVAHLGYMLGGTLHVEPDEGEPFELKTGDAFIIPPGHDAWVVGDEPVTMLDWSAQASEYALSAEDAAARKAAAR